MACTVDLSSNGSDERWSTVNQDIAMFNIHYSQSVSVRDRDWCLLGTIKISKAKRLHYCCKLVEEFASPLSSELALITASCACSRSRRFLFSVPTAMSRAEIEKSDSWIFHKSHFSYAHTLHSLSFSRPLVPLSILVKHP